MKKLVILIAGHKHSGKSFAADKLLTLLRLYGYCPARTSFAEELRRHLAILNPIVHQQDHDVRWADAITAHGYQKAKELYPEMRRLMQTYGTEVVRDRVGQNFWIEKCLDNILVFLENPGKRAVVVDDLRFENEWSMLQDRLQIWAVKVDTIRIAPLKTPEVWMVSRDTHASEDLNWMDGLVKENLVSEIRNDYQTGFATSLYEYVAGHLMGNYNVTCPLCRNVFKPKVEYDNYCHYRVDCDACKYSIVDFPDKYQGLIEGKL